MGRDSEREYREFVVARTDALRRFAYLLGGDWHLAEDATRVDLASGSPRRSRSWVHRSLVGGTHPQACG